MMAAGVQMMARSPLARTEPLLARLVFQKHCGPAGWAVGIAVLS